MARYVMQRLLAMLLTLFIIVTVAFLVIRLMPSSIYDDPTISAEVLDMIQAKYHLDRPLIEQYGIFMKNVLLKGDWGISMKIQPNIPVFQVLGGKVPLTLFINLVSLLASIPIGLVFGAFAAIKKNTMTDHGISLFVILFISIPSFIYATLLQYFAAYKFDWFPITYTVSDMASVKYLSLFLPTLSLALDPMAKVARYMRAELIESLNSEYILLARTKGFTRSKAIFRHAIRNSCIPVLNIVVPMFANVLGSSLVVESIFAIPGMGSLMIKSINANDHYLTIAILLIYSLVSLMTVLVVDLLYAVIDPRVRMGGKKQ